MLSNFSMCKHFKKIIRELLRLFPSVGSWRKKKLKKNRQQFYYVQAFKKNNSWIRGGKNYSTKTWITHM